MSNPSLHRLHHPTPVGTAVADAFVGLPESHREVLHLARSGVRFQEIAERWGMPDERVRTTALHAVLALTRARLSAADSSAPST